MIDQYDGYLQRKLEKSHKNEPNNEVRVLRAIWAAVVMQAITDLRGLKTLPGGKNQAPDQKVTNLAGVRSAYYWIFNGPPAINSFDSACLLLDLDPDRIRSELLKQISPKVIERLSSNG